MLILTPADFSVAAASGPAALLDWARSVSGQTVTDSGQSAPAATLPRDDDVVLVLPPRVVSWHRLAVPKVGSARLRAVLDGLLEDRLLSDTADLHFAIEPGGRAGHTLWVAACERGWLRGWLQALEASGRPVTRIVPALWPLAPVDGALPSLHWAHPEGDQVWLASASPLGVRCTPLDDGSGESALAGLATAAHGLLPADPDRSRWLADPAVAGLAEQVFSQRFDLIAKSAWLLQCAQSDWNLAQFDFSLSAGARRGQRLRQTLRRLRSAPDWRAARRGLGALVAVQLLGLNLAAWSERNSLSAKQQAVTQTLQQSFPQVTLVLDAPLQMQRELSRLQQASGELSGNDLEALLGALAQHSPAGAAAPGSVSFTSGELRAGGWALDDAGLSALQGALARSGWRVRNDGAELTLQAGGRP